MLEIKFNILNNKNNLVCLTLISIFIFNYKLNMYVM